METTLSDERMNACVQPTEEYFYVYVEPEGEPSMELLFTRNQIEVARQRAIDMREKLPPRPKFIERPRSFWEKWRTWLLL